MTEVNPYQTPDSELVVAVEDSGGLKGPVAQSAGSGWAWISSAFSLFARSPGMWILLIVIYMGMSLVASFIPFIGSLALSLFSVVLLAGFMIGCRSLDQGEELKVEHLFAGFSHERMNQLLTCGVLLLVASIVAGVVGAILGATLAGTMAVAVDGGGSLALGGFSLTMLLIVLLVLVFTLPVIMFTWFAAPLIVFHNVPAWEAMKLSFRGCLLNIVPFLFYGLIMLVLFALAALPLLLGFLVMAPVAVIAMYTSYKSIYL